jgi:hypothetical protein
MDKLLMTKVKAPHDQSWDGHQLDHTFDQDCLIINTSPVILHPTTTPTLIILLVITLGPLIINTLIKFLTSRLQNTFLP